MFTHPEVRKDLNKNYQKCDHFIKIFYKNVIETHIFLSKM